MFRKTNPNAFEVKINDGIVKSILLEDEKCHTLYKEECQLQLYNGNCALIIFENGVELEVGNSEWCDLTWKK